MGRWAGRRKDMCAGGWGDRQMGEQAKGQTDGGTDLVDQRMGSLDGQVDGWERKWAKAK